jgi:hypothetical protein
MNARLLFAGAVVAPVVGLATGIWAEFADLGPPLLLAVAVPAITVSLLSIARLRGQTHSLALSVGGGVLGLLTFSLSATIYILLHAVRGGGLDVNGDESGGSAVVFFAVHVAVGALVGAAVGVALALLTVVGRALWPRARRVA